MTPGTQLNLFTTPHTYRVTIEGSTYLMQAGNVLWYTDGAFGTRVWSYAGLDGSGCEATGVTEPATLLHQAAVGTNVLVELCTGSTADPTDPPADPPAPTRPTDLPDPPEAGECSTETICERVQWVLDDLQHVFAQISALSQRTQPTSYVPSESSSPSDEDVSAELPAGTNGLLITLDAPPSYWGGDRKDPERFTPRLASAVLIAGDDVLSEQPIYHLSTLLLPIPAATTRLVLKLEPGISGSYATIPGPS